MHYNILTIFIILIFICFVFISIIYLNVLSKKYFNKNDLFYNTSNHVGVKKNCNNEYIYALTSDECQDLCLPTNIFISKNGLCVNSALFNSTEIKNECSPKHGLFAYLIGDGQFGKIEKQCLSIDPGIQPNAINEKNTICLNTENFEIDYLKSFPMYTDCKCNDDETLIALPPTSVIRSRGICIKKNLENIL